MKHKKTLTIYASYLDFLCMLFRFSHSHVAIVPQFMPYHVSFATCGANAS